LLNLPIAERKALFQGFNAMAEALAAGFTWGDIGTLEEKEIRKHGIPAAHFRQKMRKASPHRVSSGQTSEIARGPGGRALAKAHRKRKGELEGVKEKERRAEWEEMNPGASESNWRAEEEARQVRRQRVRSTRKMARHRVRP